MLSLGYPASHLQPGRSSLPTEPGDTAVATGKVFCEFTREIIAHNLLHQLCRWLFVLQTNHDKNTRTTH